MQSSAIVLVVVKVIIIFNLRLIILVHDLAYLAYLTLNTLVFELFRSRVRVGLGIGYKVRNPTL